MLRTFFNNRAIAWDETIAEKNSDTLTQMASKLEIIEGNSILDVGTGTGIMIPYYLNRIGERGKLVAMDFAEEMLRISKTKFFCGPINFLHADISSLPLSEHIFDVVVCYSSFPHFHSKLKALNEIYRVLKKGGRLNICHTSNRDIINSIHKAIPLLENDLIPDSDEMLEMLSAAGFECIQIEDNAENYLARGQK